MKKNIKILFVMMTVAILAACGNAGEQGAAENDPESQGLPQPIEVEILTESDAFKPGEEGNIEIKVTQGDENVADADEVTIEIWKKGHEQDSEKFDAANDGEGHYSLAHTFAEDGIYYVVSHVTARDMHNMPKKEFQVGEVSEAAQEGEDDHDHAHGQEGVTFHVMVPDTVEAGKEDEFTVHLQKDGEPLTEANVRFEYWKIDEDKHQFVDTNETADGEYKAALTGESAGEYQLVVHVEKGELHEHKEVSFEVQ